MQPVYEAAGALPGLRRLAHAWHARVMAGEVVSHALSDIGLAGGDPLRRALHDDFACATTGAMARYRDSKEHVPRGLRIPRGSWTGPVDPAVG